MPEITQNVVPVTNLSNVDAFHGPNNYGTNDAFQPNFYSSRATFLM